MKTVSFGLMMTCVLALPEAALAQALPLPDWKILEICSKDSATGYCSAFEGRALKTVSGSWAFVPDAIRKICLDQIRRPEDRSWRLLGDCIDDAAERNIDKSAVKTAHTPGEAVPPPRPIVVAAPPPPSVPPPAPPPPSAVMAPVAAPVVPAPPPPVAQPGSIVLPPIPMPTGSPMAALEAEVAQKRAAEEAEAKRRAEAQARAAAEAEAKRKSEAEAQTKAAAEAEALARAAAVAAEAKRKADAEALAKAAAEADAKRKAELAVCQETITTASKSGVIRFATGSAALTADSSPALDRVAAAAKACPNARLSVEGHTDSSGDADKNKELSNKRAEAVVTYLTKTGIESWRIAGVDVGSAKPIASNETVEGRAENRRIEFVAAIMTDAERRVAMDAEAKRAAALAAAAEKQKAETKLCQDAINTAVQSEAIRFRTGAAVITREGAAVLDRVVIAIKSCATGRIVIEGHADATGTADGDQVLSDERAQAVVNYLTRAGIGGKRFTAIGYGRTKPIAANDTEENRAKNRRIEFVVTP